MLQATVSPPDCAYSSLFQAKGVQPAWHARAHHGASSPRSQVKGFQVAPAELEAKLLEDPCITDACVVGVPHERHGQVPKAFVVARAVREQAVVAAADTRR